HQAPRVFMKKQGWPTGLFLCITAVLLFLRFGAGVESAALVLFCALLTMISLADTRFSIIPDELLIAGGVLAVISAIPAALTQNSLMGWLSLLLGGALGAGMVLALNMIARLFYKRDALGMGDVKLLAVCGLACGLTGVLYVAVLTLFVAGGSFILLMALKKLSPDEYHPLGPYIVLATVLMLCFRPVLDNVVQWYLSLL
ncbi:MAG: prepilin peptidase, partial [Clostridia bacterium]|nr:prepilin peptidase [Clostridia bacterium]